jgi:tRNA A-37 threonylcarbamoyl transferase component Bud32/uncharacterized RDD family membrane protein YckC
MSETLKICLSCRAPLPPDAPGGLCPECRLRQPEADADHPGNGAGGLQAAAPVPGRDFGSYHIERMLGAGGMGKVFEASHRATGRRVALKVMLKALTSETDRQRFLREGRMAASVNHPNVVYVHGSEEVEGVPVIAMELVPGGTLSDRVKAAGRMPVEAAVTAALQIIAGVEAAHAAGVVHRDIKPGNCFIAADGTVKVGDFGLSISTQARVDARLTATGLALGTPAYASPEQLRGEEFDLASDIYSIGATLFHLLTGRPPFTAEDPVKLIAEVLGKEPEAPHRVRDEIPADLSRVVVHCLAKERKGRFHSYAELRDALLPFTEAVPVPAPVSRRLLAGFLDHLVATAPAIVFGTYWGMDPLQNLGRERTLLAALGWAGCTLWHLLYFTVPEGLWGAALGKMLCGVRAVGPDQRTLGISRALARTFLFLSPQWLATGDTLLLDSTLLTSLAAGAWPLLFVSMRRRNGYAALHDWLSRTRVVLRPRTQSRPLFGAWERASTRRLPGPSVDGGLAPAPASASTLGPYEIRGRLWAQDAEELLLGFDPVLRRLLWIHMRPVETGAVPALRHDLSRPARLRWLDCGTTETRRWDAYEAVEGVPLVNCTAPLPWDAARFWLLDLAEEVLAASRAPFTAASFSFDRLWLARNGQALVLDFPCPGLARNLPPAEEFAPGSPAQSQQFLDAVARRAMEGSEAGAPSASHARHPRARVPLHALGFLQNLAQSTFDRLDLVAGNLRHLAATQADISRAWRAASLALLPASLIGLLAMVAFAAHFQMLRSERLWAAALPAQPELRQAARAYFQTVERREAAGATERDVERARICFSARLRPFVHSKATPFLTHLQTVLDEKERAALQQALETPASAAALAEAQAALAHDPRIQFRSPSQIIAMLSCVFPLVLVPLSGLAEILGCVFLGFDPLLRLFGIGTVNRLGQRASRLRLSARSALAWGPAIIGSVLFGISMMVVLGLPSLSDGLEVLSGAAAEAIAWVCLAGLVLAGAIGIYFALRWPARSLADRLAETWLVPE